MLGQWEQGGGSGYTKTVSGLSIKTGTNYDIIVGAGGIGSQKAGGMAGGATSAFGYTASGGSALSSNGNYGGNGGSGGGSGSKNGDDDNIWISSGVGGKDGANGAGGKPGTGQGTTTREFGESDGILYATGGDGGVNKPAIKTANTGDGGDGGWANNASGNGASGVVVIRRHKYA